MSKKNKYIFLAAAILCITVILVITFFLFKSKSNKNLKKDELTAIDNSILDELNNEIEDIWTESAISPNIKQKYPDKKILVWLMDEFALGSMDDKWLTAFNDKLIDMGADFVLQMQKISSFDEYYNELKLYIENENQADIIYTGNLFNINSASGMSDSYMYAYQNDLLMPLDNYFSSEDGLTLFNVFDDGYWKTLSINGSIYGLNTSPYYGKQTVVTVLKTVANKFDLNKKDFTNNLSSVAMTLDVINDNIYPLDLSYNICDIVTYIGYEFIEMPISLDVNRGAFNIFEDSSFIDYLYTARTLLESGYLDPDPQGESGIAPSILPRKLVAGLLDSYYDYFIWALNELKIETAVTAIGISSTSEYPKECIKLLSWLFTNRELADLLVFGVEGENYKIEDKRISSIAGTSINPFLNWYTGLYLFTTSTYTDIDNKYEQFAEYNTNAVMTPLVGFHFNSLGWEEKILELNLIVEKYTILYEKDTKNESNPNLVTVRRTFLTGHDDDINGTLFLLNEELKAAGLDELIDEVNKQYDAWKIYSPVK